MPRKSNDERKSRITSKSKPDFEESVASESEYNQDDFEELEIEEDLPKTPTVAPETPVEIEVDIPVTPTAALETPDEIEEVIPATPTAGSHMLEKSQHIKKIKPIEMPPTMVNICQKISSQYGGLVFAFFANSSLPIYEQHCIGKPHRIVIDIKSKETQEILGKSSNQGFAAGLLVEDSKRLGKMDEKGVIREYGQPFDMPRDEKGNVPTGPDSQLGLIQHKQSLRSVFESLKEGDFKMVGEPGEDGILRVYDTRHKNPVIFSINLLDKNAIENLANARQKAPESPTWWKPSFGEFAKKIDFLYPASYETGIMHGDEVQCIPGTRPEPLMVYGIKDEQGHILPITGDQDLLWISIPRDLDLPDWATKEIDTDRKEGPSQMLEDLHRLNDYFAKKNMPTLNLFPDNEKDMANLLQVIAGFGIVTPYEAYMSILVNKELAISIPHARRLIQHGTEAHSPPALPAKEIGVVHHVGPDFAFQTDGEVALRDVVRTHKGYDKQRIDFSQKWIVKNSAWRDLKQGKKDDISDSPVLHQAPKASHLRHTRG